MSNVIVTERHTGIRKNINELAIDLDDIVNLFPKKIQAELRATPPNQARERAILTALTFINLDNRTGREWREAVSQNESLKILFDLVVFQ